MLTLSRKVGQRILIGHDIVITLVRIGANSVRIGIEAPRDTNIIRDELSNEQRLDDVVQSIEQHELEGSDECQQ